MALVPRDYQVQSVQSLFNYFRTKAGNPVVGLPTGTGKSVVIADFLKQAFRMSSNQKVLVATHVKELVQQNYLEFVEMWPTAPAGIYSAGLGRKDVNSKITFCGIASIAKKLELFGKIDLMLIDECHLVSPDDQSTYMKVIAFLTALNPMLKVIGFTATAWRQGQGRIINDGIFTDMAIDLTDMASFNRFIKEGYLCPLISKPTQTILDVSGVHLRMGEYNEKELQLAVNKDEITYAALCEVMTVASDRKHWLVFATGLDHAEKIRQMLEYLGVSCRSVHSKMSKGERNANIADWKAGKFVAIINMGILTTGVNFPGIDLIVMLRPTLSTVLWVQMLGRGTRPLFAAGYDITTLHGRLAAIQASEKPNCLVMDFAGNIRRLGPINDPLIPRKKGESTGEVPIKICDACGNYNHISARHCGGEPFKTNEGCGAAFLFQTQLKRAASTEQIIKCDEPIVEILKVDHLTCALHQKAGKPDGMRVSYFCGMNKYSSYIMVEHTGFARRKAKEWWEKRTRLRFPETTAEALQTFDQLEVPTHIRVWLNKPYPEILNESFDGGFAMPVSSIDPPF